MAQTVHRHGERTVHRDDKTRQDLLGRLNRVEGQVRGIARMIEEDRYCVDVLNQVAAARAALRQVEFRLLEEHTSHCVASAINNGNGEAAMAELMTVLRKIT